MADQDSAPFAAGTDSQVDRAYAHQDRHHRRPLPAGGAAVGADPGRRRTACRARPFARACRGSGRRATSIASRAAATLSPASPCSRSTTPSTCAACSKAPPPPAPPNWPRQTRSSLLRELAQLPAKDYREAEAANARFHLAIARAARNTLATELIERCLAQIDRFLSLGASPSQFQAGASEAHLQIVDAIARRDPAAAGR